jgi:dienelactone hydrolase
MKIIDCCAILSTAIFCLSTCVQAFDDPFIPYLSTTPTVFKTISEVRSGSGTAAITTKKFTFLSRGGIDTVYAVMASPQQAGRYPAIMFLHGGGSNAETMIGNIQYYAARGYAAIAPDLPGICGTANTPNSNGPWKSRPLGEGPRFDVAAGPQNSTLVDAEVAGLEAFNFLRAQPFTDTSKMGITGSSWGGYSTTFLSGILGGKVKASWAYLGCGFYDKGSFWKAMLDTMNATTKATWLTFFDAGRRAPQIAAPYFLEAASNDTYFWPEAVMATLGAVPGIKNHFWGPNLNHQGISSPMKELFFNYYLKGAGFPFPAASIYKTETMNDGGKKITVALAIPAGVTIDTVYLYYSKSDTNWQARLWQPLVAKKESGVTYSAVLSKELVAAKADYYAIVKDSRGVAVSSSMHSAASPVTGIRGAIPAHNATGCSVYLTKANRMLHLRIPLRSPCRIAIRLYSLRGSLVQSRAITARSAGVFRTDLNAGRIYAGIYMMEIAAEGENTVHLQVIIP